MEEGLTLSCGASMDQYEGDFWEVGIKSGITEDDQFRFSF